MQFLHSPILIICILIISLLIIIFLISFYECKNYEICNLTINNHKNSFRTKIVFLSDFHNKLYPNDNKSLIDDILNLNPDYIVLGGDFINYSAVNSLSERVKYKNTLKFFNDLSEEVKDKANDSNFNLKKMYFSYGNHELRLIDNISNEKLNDVYNEFRDSLIENGIELIDNNIAILNDGITLSGLSLYKGYYYNIFKTETNHEHIDRVILDKYFKNLDRDSFNIIAFHKPDYADDLINYGFDLVLSGHNHGGLIKLPFVGSIISPDFRLFTKYSSGLYKIGDKNVIVSDGIGEHFIRIRVNNRPKIYAINIV